MKYWVISCFVLWLRCLPYRNEFSHRIMEAQIEMFSTLLAPVPQMLPYWDVWSSLFIHSLQPPLPFSKLSVFHFLILLHVSNHSPFFRNTLVPQLPSHQPPRFLSPGPTPLPPYTKHHTCNHLHHLSYLLLVDWTMSKGANTLEDIAVENKEGGTSTACCEHRGATASRWGHRTGLRHGAQPWRVGKSFPVGDKVGKTLEKLSADTYLCVL